MRYLVMVSYAFRRIGDQSDRLGGETQSAPRIVSRDLNSLTIEQDPTLFRSFEHGLAKSLSDFNMLDAGRFVQTLPLHLRVSDVQLPSDQMWFDLCEVTSSPKTSCWYFAFLKYLGRVTSSRRFLIRRQNRFFLLFGQPTRSCRQDRIGELQVKLW